ncbi:MAG: RHS repeat domain-containing protein [Chlamydiales bacterium]
MHTTLIAYSYEDVLTKTTTNPKGIQTIITYDSRGRETLRLKKNAKGEIIQRSESFYNKNGNPIQLIHTIFLDAVPIKTITHYWEYGPLGRLERFVEAGEKETRYLYDTKGRLQTIVKPDGRKLIHAYDDCGRLARYHSTDFDYQYTYDPRNRVTSVLDALSNTCTRRTYDPLSNIVQETLANGLTFSNIYDIQGRRITCSLPDASTITYSYDGIYLYAISRNGYTHTYSGRNLEGQMTHALSPAGEIGITRDALGRYISLNAPHFSESGCQYDPTGNLIHYAFQDETGRADRHYTYDDLDQLIQEDSHRYQFDSILNRLKKDAYEYAINSLCQVTHDGKTSYTYDRCGSLISDDTRTYSYDSLDRLIAVEEGDQKTAYTYDPFHRRLSKMSYLKGRKLKTIRYIWDGNHEIGTVDEQNRIQELRILGEGLGAEIGAAILYELNGKSYIPIHDHQGCIVTLIDPTTQKSVESYRYTAFGEEQTAGTRSPWRFSSKRTDEETGFVFFGRRYYHSELGRWITQDPQGFGDGPNLYAYVHNCPLMEIDFYGLSGMGQCFNSLSRMAFRTLEWTGANLLPIPYVRNFVESVGRWGAGGEFGGPSRYRTGKSEIITIPGRTVPGHSYTHGNGMLTNKTDAIKQAEYVSQTHGDIQVDLMYHGTEGLIMDLIGCGLSKLGTPTSYNKMCANYYQSKLQEDPNYRFTSSVHSRGGIQMMNTGRFLSPEQREHIDVIAYGSATLIPRGYFRSAKNNLSSMDVVTMTNPLAYCVGLLGQQYDMNFLSPSTHCPWKAHGFSARIYAEEIKKRGDEFKELYFND